MDYVTLHIDKKFLILLTLLVLAVIAVKQSYNYGYNKGVMNAFAYVEEVTGGNDQPL